ncbi:hypothetical protein ACVIU4_006005 [Bradyrhizobium barranii subsp. barranii]
MWSLGHYRGVISKIDLLYAIAGAVTPEHLSLYFAIARMVLGEDDPALDLDDDQRWAASLHGKTREFSAAFREGISETLVLLAVHGENLFKRHLGVDTEFEAMRVVRDLLPTPLTTRILEAHDRDLPTYAEAAPNEFLSIIERDLRSKEPAVFGLLRPADAGVFGRSPSRTGLLWALEGLSWNPVTLPRAAAILARLAQVEINDNWVNKPTHSLESIFRAWMPQTAASHRERVELMQKLAQKFPDVAWKICVSQFSTHSGVGDYSHKPRWRADGYGFGEPFSTRGPIDEFVREMIEMALTWRDHSLSMLCDLVDRLQSLIEADQNRVWTLIEDWAKNKASDGDKAAMREKIRVATLSRRAAVRAKKGGKPTSFATAGKTAYRALEPIDLLNKHAWLFRDTWIEESADEIEDVERYDYNAREERIKSLRAEALREVIEQRGFAGILELSKRGKASWMIGVILATLVLSEQELRELLRLALDSVLAGREEVHAYRNLIGGALHSFIGNSEKLEAVLRGVAAGLSEQEIVRLFVLAPYGKRIWQLVDALSEVAHARYWSDVTPDWIRNSDAENNESVERLLKAKRPRAAFSCIRHEPSKLDAQVLFNLLSAMALGGEEQPGHYMLDHHSIEEGFKHLNSSHVLTMDEKAGLEFAYIEVLARRWDRRNHYGIPNLERYVELHPELFVQAIAWTYKRKDGANDPAEFQVPPERVTTMAERGYKLLEAIERIPGHNDLGELETERLAKWLATVRQSCAELDRADIADNCVGKVLSGAPTGKDGVWPCEPVRDVMEDIQSEAMMRGAHTGVYNSRGVHGRGEGGDQERNLAEKYRKWGLALQTSHPFVSSQLLMVIAKTYDHQATREDTAARIRRRLR